MLDDWKGNPVLARIGDPKDGAIELRCTWDGTSLGLSLDIADDRVVRVRSGKGHEDRVDISLSATGGKPIAIVVYPGNAIVKEKILAPANTQVGSTPSFELRVNFHDADQATGGDDTDLVLATTINLGDRKDLLDDFLRTAHLKHADIKVDVMADLDPDRRGKERLVAGGTVIGVITDQFAYVTLPAQTPSDVREVRLIPLGAGQLQVVEAIVRQSGNGGSRDLLMLWTVWSGQLQPLAQVEVRKQQGASLLESEWKIAKSAHGPELVVTPKPAVGWNAETWNEQAADDADPILLPWDTKKSGTGYTLHGHEVSRRDLAARRKH